MLGGLMVVVPAIAGVVMKPFSSKTETKQVRKNLEMILSLREQLNNQNISDAVRKATNDKINKLETENKQILTSVAEKSKGLWNVYENERGESSLRLHKPKLVWKSCKFIDHEFEVTGNREWSCTKCNFKFIPIIGMHQLIDGKIVETTPPPLSSADKVE
jgi:gas vesicle protein